MTPEQKAAYILAQIAMMYAERSVMEAENHEREQQGYAHAYGSKQWQEFHDRWASTLSHNAVIQLFLY